MDQQFSYIGKKIVEWYALNQRDLPWRHSVNPYEIWISEIILQQTRVAQGYDYYVKFLKKFPDIKSLAEADEDEVLNVWQGLGYYSRARNLHAAAKTILSDYQGVFPHRYADILALKGVGEYTAAAISSFVFNLPHAVVDGNVYRVISRIFAIETPIDTNSGKKVFQEMADQLMNKETPGLHNQAIMEFGALQCVPVSPDCLGCPLSEVCVAYAQNKVACYPVKQGKTKVTERFFNYLDIRSGSFIYLNKRTGNDIWKNLYELPLIETPQKVTFDELQDTDNFKSLFENSGDILLKSTPVSLKHILSHRIIYAVFYKLEISDDSQIRSKYLKTDINSLHNFAISRLVDRYFELTRETDLFS